MNHQLLTSAMALLALLSAACSPKVEVTPTPLPPPEVQIQEVALGKWSTGCVQYQGQQIYVVSDLIFERDRLTATGQAFADSQCRTSPLGQADTKIGTYKIGPPSASAPGAFEFEAVLPDGFGGWETNFDILMIQNGLMYFSESPGVDAQSRPKDINFRMPYRRMN